MIKNVLIILNYNDFDCTANLISKVKFYKSINKIIVVDNKSTDNSFEKLLRFSNEKICVIQTNSNNGYASGNNYGATYAIENYNPEFLTIANPDIEFEDNTLESMLLFFDTAPHNTGVVSCKMISKINIHTPVAWRLPKYSDNILANLIILRKIIGNQTEYNDDYFIPDISAVDVLPGSFFIIKSMLFKKIGMFDERTFLYFEENILSFKLNKSNYKNYIMNRCSYLHIHSVGINKNISSVSKRLEILHKSTALYNNEYLNISNLKKIFFEITYYLGKFNYLSLLYFFRLKR